MPTLGLSQKPIVMPTYPHMLSEDTAVWTKYLQSPLVPIHAVWYDIHVGAPIPTGPGATDADRQLAAAVGKKRIDVIARVGGGYWVIEVKPFGGMLAVGQVISYHRLFIAEFVIDGEAWPVIICDSVDADLIDECEELGVAVIVND